MLHFLGLQPTTVYEYKFWHARRKVFIQCSLTGTALSWYIRLNGTYKQDCHAFVQAFKKQFSSQKNAYYAQVEALSLIKKDSEIVRHFALRVQQLFEKGWCNENASTINLKCTEIFTKGLPKNLKGFANKRQVKHTTVLEPSIPFHTLVKLVDAEDNAKDKRRTHDLTLEVNNITKQLQTQTIDSQQSDQVLFAQPRDPNNKIKPAYKKYCSYCHRTNHSISACFKTKEMMKTDVMPMHDRNLLSTLLYSISVHLPMTKHQGTIPGQITIQIDIAVQVHLVITIREMTVLNIEKYLHLELVTIMIEILLLRITLDHVMIIIKETLDDIVHHTGLLIDHHTHVIHVLDTNLDLTPEIITSKNTHLQIDLLQDLEIPDISNPDYNLIHEVKQ